MIRHFCNICESPIPNELVGKPFIRRLDNLTATVLVLTKNKQAAEDVCEGCVVNIIVNGTCEPKPIMPPPIEEAIPAGLRDDVVDQDQTPSD